MSYTDYFRYPHTKNEMKQFYASGINEVDVSIKIRGRRHPKCLPNSWDDYYRSNMRLRNWKAYRKQQWK
ncbi:hypothetical protein ACJJI3_09950 [Microbulbifer sp. ZKSA004]|uniref:hypothetical protein n=1 Tax=Microbulbifer sp. ZKSA004 TaxID=3243389 RepID=UPI0040397349